MRVTLNIVYVPYLLLHHILAVHVLMERRREERTLIFTLYQGCSTFWSSRPDRWQGAGPEVASLMELVHGVGPWAAQIRHCTALAQPHTPRVSSEPA